MIFTLRQLNSDNITSHRKGRHFAFLAPCVTMTIANIVNEL